MNDTKQVNPAAKRRPPAAGKGRKLGSLNKGTKNAREAIALLVDGNAERMQGWLDQIAADQGPLQAWNCLRDVMEYHLPKIARTEHTGPDGKDIPVAITITHVKP